MPAHRLDPRARPRPTSFRPLPDDLEALPLLREAWGFAFDADVIRCALRRCAAEVAPHADRARWGRSAAKVRGWYGDDAGG